MFGIALPSEETDLFDEAFATKHWRIIVFDT